MKSIYPKQDALRFAELEGDREVSTSPPAIREKYKDDMSGFVKDLDKKLSCRYLLNLKL
jgi:hypothetical protein